MKKYLLLPLVIIFFSTAAQAQLNPFKKKKENAAVQDTAAAKTEEPEKEEKKKGGGLFQKVVAKVAKVAGNASGAMLGTTKTTDNFDVIEPAIFVSSNIYPKSVGTMQTDFYNGWREGGDLVGVMLLPKDKAFFYKLDGTVKVNGDKADYQTAGVYTKILDGSNSNKVLEMETKSGKTAKFTLIPKQNKIKLLSVNGQTKNAVIDMAKDFTIELDGFTPNAFIKIEVVMQKMGFRGQFEVGSYRAAKSITIPGYIFQHMNVGPDQADFKYTNPYIFVSETEVRETKDENGNYKEPVKYFAGTSSYMAVNVVNPVSNGGGLTVRDGDCRLEKGNAYFSPPVEMATKIATTTLVVKGTTYYYDVSESKAVDRTVTTTKELKFPQIPDSKLEAVAADLYQQMTAILKEELNATVIAPEQVTGNTAYKKLGIYMNEDENTEEHFRKSHKGLNEPPAMAPLAFSINGQAYLFEPLQANALLKTVLDLKISWQGKKPTITPYLNIELKGMPNGGINGAAQLSYYFKGTVTGESIELTKGVVTEEMINRILQVSNLTGAFRKGLQKLKAKEKETAEYTTIWSLQQ
jgi:hypothetical protein